MKRVLSTGDIDAASLLIGDNTDSCGPFTQQKGRRKKQRKVNAVTNNNTDDTGALQSVQSTQSTQFTQSTQSVESNTAPTPSEVSLLRDKIDELLCTVHSQHETIKVLSEKLNFVLSFLNVPGSSAVQDGIRCAVGRTTETDTVNLPRPSTSSLEDSQGVPDQRHTVQSTSYSDAVGTQVGQIRHQPSNFREIVAEAISAEQRACERRAKSVIVTGLAVSAGTNDKLCFKRMCMKELGIEPQISFTRRLGGDRGGAQPLLVGLNSEQDASDLLNRAKTLRQSSSEAVRRNVYINRNLSKEEARLAYEARRRRRHRQQQNRRDLQQSVGVSLSAGAAEFVPDASDAHSSSTAAMVHTNNTTDSSQAGRHR